MQPCIPGHDESGGVVLAEVMAPAELTRFEETGVLPDTRRPCVLCTRANVTDAYVRLRQERGKTDGKAEAKAPPPYVLNWYANPMGEGGYAESACIPFADDGDAWTAVFGTFVAFAPGARPYTSTVGDPLPKHRLYPSIIPP